MPFETTTSIANYSAYVLKLFSEISYPVSYHDTIFEPFLHLLYSAVHTSNYQEDLGEYLETGSDFLSGSALNGSYLFATLGLRLSQKISKGIVFYAESAWREGFGKSLQANHSFYAPLVKKNPLVFTVEGYPIATSSLILNTGLDFTLNKSFSFGIGYNGELSLLQKSWKHNLQINISASF